MTLSEITKAKHALEQSIERALNEFMRSTGTVPRVSLDYEEVTFSSGETSATIRVEVEVVL